MKFFLLSNGKEAIVDDEDFERVNKLAWHQNSNGYIANCTRINGKTVVTKLHHFILNNERSRKNPVDHINRNQLDNRRENLRICTASDNAYNRTFNFKNKTSNYRGVYKIKSCKKWYAKIKRLHLGVTENEKEAAMLYDKKAKELFGEFAILNFPIGS